jgi:hypothetical protein
MEHRLKAIAGLEPSEIQQTAERLGEIPRDDRAV